MESWVYIHYTFYTTIVGNLSQFYKDDLSEYPLEIFAHKLGACGEHNFRRANKYRITRQLKRFSKKSTAIYEPYKWLTVPSGFFI